MKKLTKGTISDDEVVASYVPPRYLLKRRFMLFHFDHDVMDVEEFTANGVIFERHRVEDFDEAMVILNHLRQTRLDNRLSLFEVAERSARR